MGGDGLDAVREPLEEAERIGGVRAWLNATDLAVYKALRRLAIESPHVDRVRAYSSLGEYGALWFAIGPAGILGDRPRARRWARGAVAVGIAHAASSTIKLVVNRRRPAIEDLPHLMGTPTGLSFPSTHSTCSFAAARAYSGLLPAAPLYALASAMAVSRIYLGVHYPSDVLAGASLGLVMGSIGR